MSEETAVPSINVNTEVTNIDETTTSGQNSYSFNEIEKALEQREAKVKATKPEKTEKVEKSVNTEVLDEKAPVSEVKTKEEKKAEKEAKKLIAKYGEQILELHPEALIPHKVDGKEVEIPVMELLNNYSGKVAYDKRFHELDVDKKTYSKEKAEWQRKTKEVDDFVTDFFNKARSGKAIEAFEMLAQGAGQDPMEFTRQLKANILKEYENYANMSEEDRALHDKRQEVEFYDRQIGGKKEALSRQQEVEAESKNIDAFCSNHGVEFADFERTYQTLVAELSKRGVDPQSLTVKDVEKYYVEDIAYSKAEDALGKLKPEWKDNDDIVDVVAAYVRKDIKATPEAVEAYVMQTFGLKTQKSASQVLKEPTGKPLSAGLQKQPVTNKKPMFFSDL